jgi:hypothetical protein
MSDNPSGNENIKDAFHQLGENLVRTVRAAWEAPERQKLQQEIETGLSDLADTVRKEVNTFNESPTGQKLKTEMTDLYQGVRTTVSETSLRDELLKALNVVNKELESVAAKIKRAEVGESQAQPAETMGDEDANPPVSG